MNIDHLRGLTVYVIGAPDGSDEKIELCPGARVYSVSLRVVGRDPAVLRLQDSSFEVRQDYPLDADISPGIAWPAFSRLIVPAGTTANLHVTYGDCS